MEGRGLLEQALYLDTRMFLPDGILLCNDKMSMAAGLELRVPFLDRELMRFVERIPATARVRPGRPKRLHKRAMRNLLPARIVNRKKHGFATPYDDWLRASLGEEVERRYAPGSVLAELIDPGAASTLVDEHRRGPADHKAMLYCLLELSEWHRAFVEQREPVPA
jgi:asparagine synthase (glutamine-hydrolysing)